ncbi:adenylosuccinate synthetase [Elsinoe australis]|uniref:Adenylosuccinate synthetase n=1 Tax=Elsinoe australis TaxID=40998 RepID=A0A2P8A5Q2_9PEZI|nr:Adenylosuccinate synthetase [Elsinoe australis]TKX25648.1 adenylosuccinate synthetase [Elsinoe australis]
MTTVVLGSQFGDEGKGKLVDILSRQFPLICRSAGGHNAGHTIVVSGTTYDFHILPSGLINPSSINLIGSACVVSVPQFFHELTQLNTHGLDTKDRIFISDRAHVLFELHSLVDGLEEVELGDAKVGTTKKGIGPAYQTKHGRSGVRVGEVFDKEGMDAKLRTMAKAYQKRYGDLLKYDVEAEIKRFDEWRPKLAEFVVDQVPLISSAEKQGRGILVEGANALMLDIDWGTYPMVTSSNTGIGGVFTGLGLSPFKVKEVIGVVKAYQTRVGGGPFPTELEDEVGDKLQSVGREFGVTTGRRRRCGWLDLVLLQYSTLINHYTCFNLTKLDVLDDFDELKVAVAYKVDGQEAPAFPATLAALKKVEVVYKTFPGWKSKTTGVNSFSNLPENARKYVEFVEEFTGVPVKWIGTGPGREAMIQRQVDLPGR